MLSPFISRLLLVRQFSIIEKEMKVLDENFYMQPMQHMVRMQVETKKRFGQKGLDLIYDVAKESFLGLSSDLEKFSENRGKFFDVLANVIKNMGFGEIEIVQVRPEQHVAIVQLKYNPFAKEYVKRFGFQKQNLDYHVAGMIAGYFTKFFGTEVECKEDSCMGRGQPTCKFTVRWKEQNV
jgi:predicted hydrocarbon binding protein